MVYCTDLNLLINFKTIVSWFQVTPDQTKPKLGWIIGNLGRDKLANGGGKGGGEWRVLHCVRELESWTGKLNWKVELRTNLVRSWEQCWVSYLICFCFRFLVSHLYRCSALTNWVSKPAESWSLIVGNIPGKDDDEMMNIWISYIWTAELKKKKKNEENMIIAVKDATLPKESLKNLTFAGIWLELVIFCEVE